MSDSNSTTNEETQGNDSGSSLSSNDDVSVEDSINSESTQTSDEEFLRDIQNWDSRHPIQAIKERLRVPVNYQLSDVMRSNLGASNSEFVFCWNT